MERNQFDIIIVGTGLAESILAGALARNSKSVLHLEPGKQYGSEYKVLNIQEFVAEYRERAGFQYYGGESDEFCKFKETLLDNIEGDLKAFNSCWFFNRQVLIDLMPKFVYASGEVIDLLVTSKVGPYLEFQLPKKFGIIASDTITPAPMSKEDIFASQDISLVEKRKLMKFLKSCLNFEPGMTNINTSNFLDHMRESGLSEGIMMIIISSLNFQLNLKDAIQMDAIEGIERIQRFLQSANRYGPSPLLYANYGTGSELCQCFCRYAAVFGASYILDCSINSLDTSSKMKTIDTDYGIFTAPELIIASSSPIQITSTTNDQNISSYHYMVCISQAQFGTSSDHSLYFKCPDLNTNRNGIVGIQFCQSNQMCPEGTFILNLRTAYCDSSLDSLEKVAQHLSNGMKTLNRTLRWDYLRAG